MRINKFIPAIFLTIGIAYFLPQGDELPLNNIIDIGIGFIFFFYGLKLSPNEFKIGIKNYWIHIIIHVTTFIIFPLLCLATIPIFKDGMQSHIWIALFFFGTLPSSISSSVVMVSIARGNVPAAIFNASLSGLIGIFVTPIWLEIVLGKTADFDFATVLWKLFLQIILPLTIGLLMQPLFGKWVRKHADKLSRFDKSVILLIIYSSFSKSFTSHLFDQIKIIELVKMIIILIVLFFLIFFGLLLLCNQIGLKRDARITAQFCGTKKSLIHGTVMVKVIFGHAANSGILLLPIMLYHSTQLVIIAWFAERYAKQKEKSGG